VVMSLVRNRNYIFSCTSSEEVKRILQDTDWFLEP
jgi:hypothetical protein